MIVTNIIINGQGATFVFGYMNRLRKMNVCEPPSPLENVHFSIDIFWNHTLEINATPILQ